MVLGYTVVKKSDLEHLEGLLFASERRIEDLRSALELAGVDVSQTLSELRLIRELLGKEKKTRRAEIVMASLGIAAVLAQPIIAYEYANLRDGERPSVVAEFQTSCSRLARQTEGVAVPASLRIPAIPDSPSGDPADDFRQSVKRGKAITDELMTTIGNTPYPADEVENVGEVTSFDMEEQLGESVKREIADRDRARARHDEHPEATGQRSSPVELDDVLGLAPQASGSRSPDLQPGSAPGAVRVTDPEGNPADYGRIEDFGTDMFPTVPGDETNEEAFADHLADQEAESKAGHDRVEHPRDKDAHVLTPNEDEVDPKDWTGGSGLRAKNGESEYR